jgi:hypothetical protein
MFDDYVSVDSTPLYRTSSGTGTVCHLLWGDGVRFEGGAGGGSRRRVTARGGREGYVAKSALGGKSLLEFYFIDVGQGDGILIKTPAFRHVMIDGGFPRSQQDTRKNAADFVDWKFVKDYGKNKIRLDAMLASHCDADHYGGLDDLLDAGSSNELKATGITVDAFFHAGLSWWKKGNGKSLGKWTTLGGEKFWTQLLEDRSHAMSVTGSGGGAKLNGWWHNFVEKVVEKAKTRSGNATPIQRLSHASQFVPGFCPGNSGEPTIHVLGPVEFTLGNNKPALRRFSGGNSKNTNGVSLLLRVDYGRTRVLLTGDLNRASQHTLLDDYAGERTEFLCDVAKACHHGSEDVSYQFLQAMRPAVTA